MFKRLRHRTRGNSHAIPLMPLPSFYHKYRFSPSWSAWLSKVRGFCKFSSVSQFSSLHTLSTDNRPLVNINIGNFNFIALIDTGANRSLIGGLAWNQLRSCYGHCLKPVHFEVFTADGSQQSVLGSIQLPVSSCDRVGEFNFLIVPTITHSIVIGADFCAAFNLELKFTSNKINICPIKADVSIDSTDHSEVLILNQMIDAFKTLSTDSTSRTTIMLHHIDTGSAQPFRLRQYPFSPAMLRHLYAELDRMLSEGVVEPSDSPWCSPVLLVKKKSGDFRFCFDGRKLNQVTVKDAYPLPRIDHILDRLRDAKYLSTIDLRQAFWQIPLDSESKPKTAFAIPGRGLFNFTVLPFGLANSPKVMQRMIDKIFGPELEPFIFCYIDDIVISTSSFEKHIEVLSEVFRRLKTANLTINFDKCHFCKPSLKYLGYVVDKDGLHTDPEKVAAVSDYPLPTTVTQIKRFLGLVSWYRRFIPEFSSLTSPITALTHGKRKSNPIAWNSEAELAFDEIKQRLASSPVLATPDFSREFTIQTDASNYGVGAVLSQQVDGIDHPIAYASKTLTKAQRNYSVTERECLGVLFGIEKFRPYIEGTHFSVVTDHSSLMWLRDMKDPVGRLCRWAIKLSQFDFDLIHRSGTLNVVADALSRIEANVIEVSLPVADNWYARVLSGVTQYPERYPLYQLRNGKLYYHRASFETPMTNLDPWKLVLPRKYRAAAFEECHASPTAAHLGIDKTYHRLSELYHWPGMRRDTLLYVSSCKVCAAHKADNKLPAGIMGVTKKVCYPFQMLAIDFLGPLPRSSSGNQYLLVVVDVFSKNVFLKPFSRATSQKVVKYLEEDIFLLFGIPQTLVCDNGSQFVSKQFSALAAKYNVRNIFFNARYHPQNNPAERVNRVVVTAISSFLHENHRAWDQELPKIAQALRLAKHEATGYSPAFLNFGRAIPMSGNFYGTLRDMDHPQKIQQARDYAQDLCKLDSIYKKVVENLRRAYVHAANHYNLRRRDVIYKVGDRVWKRDFPQSNAAAFFSAKLAPKYVPCIVTKKTGNVTYQLSDPDGRDLGVWHVQRLKPDLSTFDDDVSHTDADDPTEA